MHGPHAYHTHLNDSQHVLDGSEGEILSSKKKEEGKEKKKEKPTPLSLARLLNLCHRKPLLPSAPPRERTGETPQPVPTGTKELPVTATPPPFTAKGLHGTDLAELQDMEAILMENLAAAPKMAVLA